MSKLPRPGDAERVAAPDPVEPLGTFATTNGTVKFWRGDKGHGAIASAQTAPFDIWCHFSALEMNGFKELVAGQHVVVEYERADQDSFKYRAISVRVIEP